LVVLYFYLNDLSSVHKLKTIPFSFASAKVRRFLESAKCFVGKFDFVVVFLSKMTFFQELNHSIKAKAEAPFEFASAFVLFFSRGA